MSNLKVCSTGMLTAGREIPVIATTLSTMIAKEIGNDHSHGFLDCCRSVIGGARGVLCCGGISEIRQDIHRGGDGFAARSRNSSGKCSRLVSPIHQVSSPVRVCTAD